MKNNYINTRFLTFRWQLLWLIVAACTFSCDIKKNNKETDPKKDFIKIFENNNFSSSLIPIDVEQTSDGGFIILAKRRITESPFYGVYVMKADELGNFVSEQNLETEFVNPVPNLMKLDGNYYFFAMNRVSLESRLMYINESGTATEVATIPEAYYPLCASVDPHLEQMVLQHYNPDDRKTIISRITTSAAVSAERQFSVGVGDFDYTEPIIDHLTGTGKKLPFFTGSISDDRYFFNGFYQYAVSTVFFDFNSATPGVLQGYQDERSLSAALPISGNRFAISRYAYGENYINPIATISTSGVSSNGNIPGNLMVEFSPDAEVVIKKISMNGRNVIVYNTDTKSKQICLYFYDESSGALLGSRHFGFSNPYEAASFISTQDGGIALVGTTYLAGRFPRIVLIKVSKEELSEIVK